MVDQLTLTTIRDAGGGHAARKGAVKERLLHVGFVVTKGTESQRVHRYTLALRTRRELRVRLIRAIGRSLCG